MWPRGEAKGSLAMKIASGFFYYNGLNFGRLVVLQRRCARCGDNADRQAFEERIG